MSKFVIPRMKEIDPHAKNLVSAGVLYKDVDLFLHECQDTEVFRNVTDIIKNCLDEEENLMMMYGRLLNEAYPYA